MAKQVQRQSVVPGTLDSALAHTYNLLRENSMDQFLKMDVFFAVTTAMVIILGILLAFILWRVFRILGHVEHISDIASDEAGRIREDVRDLRAHVRAEGLRLFPFTQFFRRFFQRIFRNRGKR